MFRDGDRAVVMRRLWQAYLSLGHLAKRWMLEDGYDDFATGTELWYDEPLPGYKISRDEWDKNAKLLPPKGVINELGLGRLHRVAGVGHSQQQKRLLASTRSPSRIRLFQDDKWNNHSSTGARSFPYPFRSDLSARSVMGY